MKKWLLLLATILLLAPNFINADINPHYESPRNESFNSQLSHLDNTHKLSVYIDSIADKQNIYFWSPEYLLLVESTVASRFHHGFSRYSLNENWMAAVGEKAVGYNLACIVLPDDILKYDVAACSQQAIVMMDLLKRKKIDYRILGFPHHYAMEANLGQYWYFMDANQEPNMSIEDRMHRNWKGDNDNLKAFYNSSVYTNLDYGFGKGKHVIISAINEIPASKATAFHKLSFVLSKIFWLLPFSALLYLFFPPRFKTYRFTVSRQNNRQYLQPSLSV